MSTTAPLFETIEADDPDYEQRTASFANANASSGLPPPVTQPRQTQSMATTAGDSESGMPFHPRNARRLTDILFRHSGDIPTGALLV